MGSIRVAELNLGKTGGIGIIEYMDATFWKVPGKKLGEISVDPAWINVCGGVCVLVLHHGGEGDAHGTIPLSLVQDGNDGFCDGVSSGGFRGKNLDAITDKFAGF